MRIKKLSSARRTGPIATASGPMAATVPTTPTPRTIARPGGSQPRKHPASTEPRSAATITFLGGTAATGHAGGTAGQPRRGESTAHRPPAHRRRARRAHGAHDARDADTTADGRARTGRGEAHGNAPDRARTFTPAPSGSAARGARTSTPASRPVTGTPNT